MDICRNSKVTDVKAFKNNTLKKFAHKYIQYKFSSSMLSPMRVDLKLRPQAESQCQDQQLTGGGGGKVDFCTFLLSPRREESECTTRSTPPQAESFKNVAFNNCQARYRLKKCRVYGRKYFCKNNIQEIKKSFFVIFILFIIIKIHIREQFREKNSLIFRSALRCLPLCYISHQWNERRERLSGTLTQLLYSC